MEILPGATGYMIDSFFIIPVGLIKIMAMSSCGPKSYSPQAVYDQRIQSLDLRMKRLARQGKILGACKLVIVFGALLFLFRVLVLPPSLSLILFGLALALFTASVWIHESIIRRSRHLNVLKTINKNELKFLAHEFPEAAHQGEEFLDADHAYSADLDIFAEKGLFHFVNRSVTAIGRSCLADWLRSRAESDEVKKRQQAVAELAQQIDLRQNVAGCGMFIDDSSQKLGSLYRALEESFLLLGNKWLLVFLYAWPLLTIAAAALIAVKIPLAVFFSLALSQYAVNRKFAKPATHLYELTSRSQKILKAYSRIINEIETASFSCEKLNQLQGRLSTGQEKASLEIRRLSRLLEWFDARHGMLHVVFNNILLWDLHCVYRIEKWRKRTAPYVPLWFSAIGEFEALSGFAALRFNHPLWVLPEIKGNTFFLQGQNFGHPLIPENERVGSDIELGTNGKAHAAGSLAIVTGPNMAGKSTFLKAVGSNAVLAFAGAPVCAERWVISSITLITCMKTSDSLGKHVSLFYAELQRLKMILDSISGGEPVFFLIDEMLKGTNAADRHKGSLALLKQLLRSGANGIVATHDLELTRLENPEEWQKPGGAAPADVQIANYHFDGTIEGDKLLFDFRLKRGVCESHNAFLLMKNMGIDI